MNVSVRGKIVAMMLFRDSGHLPSDHICISIRHYHSISGDTTMGMVHLHDVKGREGRAPSAKGTHHMSFTYSLSDFIF